MYNKCVKYEWDEEKSKINQDKHGIDFEAAKNLWLDEDQIEIYAPYPIEDRRIIIAKYHNMGCHIHHTRWYYSHHICEACKKKGGGSL